MVLTPQTIGEQNEIKPCVRCNASDHDLRSCPINVASFGKVDAGALWKDCPPRERMFADLFVFDKQNKAKGILDQRYRFADRAQGFEKFKQEADAPDQNSIFEIRPTFAAGQGFDVGRSAPEINVATNHFFLDESKLGVTIHQYFISGILNAQGTSQGDVPSRSRRRELMDLAFYSSRIWTITD